MKTAQDKRTRLLFCQRLYFSRSDFTFYSMIVSIVLSLLFFARISHELDNGLGRTPQMGKSKGEDLGKNQISIFPVEGWNSWNHFHCDINETVVRQTADAMVATGLTAAGYQYGMPLSSLSVHILLFFSIFCSEYG